MNILDIINIGHVERFVFQKSATNHILNLRSSKKPIPANYSNYANLVSECFVIFCSFTLLKIGDWIGDMIDKCVNTK